MAEAPYVVLPPPLRDRRPRRLAVILLGVIIVALLYVSAMEAKRSADRMIGVGIETGASQLEVVSVTEGLPAARAGVEAGDSIIAVAGRPTRTEPDYDAVAQEFRRGRPVELVVLRHGREVTLEVRPGAPMPWGGLALQTLLTLAYLVLALVALVQRPNDPRARLLFLFAYAVGLEMALPTLLVGEPLMTILTSCAFYLVTGFQMGVELHLASVIPDPQRWLRGRSWVVPLYYAAGMAMGLGACWSYLADQVGVPAPPLLGAGAQTEVLDVVMPLWAVAVVALVGYQALHHPEPTGRHRAGLVLVGVLPWSGYIVATSILSFVGHDVPGWLSGLEPVVLLVYPVLVFVAISRTQLFDLELVVRRGLVYTMLTGTLVLIFYAAVGAGGALAAQLVEGSTSVWVIAGATLLLGLLFSPLHRAVQRLVERRFFPERHLVRQRLAELTAELATVGKLPIMGRHLVDRLSDVLAVRAATLLVADPKSHILLTLASSKVDTQRNFDLSFLLSPEDPGVRALASAGRPMPAAQLAPRSPALAQRLQFFDAALAVPIALHGRLVGLLLIGPKRTGEPFRAEETELLSLLAHHVATVLENARLYESATFDGLTGLLRREAILDLLEKELARAVRYRRPFTVGMADIDRFKSVNDRFGHLVGDTVLTLVARALSSGLRSTDSVGRYGGEEFLLLLPETDLAGAGAVAEKLRRLVQEIELTTEGGEIVRTTISIGLTSLGSKVPGARLTAEALIAAADANLLSAKEEGRNLVVAEAGQLRSR